MYVNHLHREIFHAEYWELYDKYRASAHSDLVRCCSSVHLFHLIGFAVTSAQCLIILTYTLAICKVLD